MANIHRVVDSWIFGSLCICSTLFWIHQQNLADLKARGYMKELEYVILIIWLEAKGFPPLTKQSS